MCPTGIRLECTKSIICRYDENLSQSPLWLRLVVRQESMMDLRIIPYSPDYEASLLDLERASPQGNHLRLEMLRDHFLSRSRVFDEFGVFLAVGGSGGLLGVAAGSAVMLECNGSLDRVGYVYDVRVAVPFRRKGIAQSLIQYVTREYFGSLGIERYITTIKASNRPAAKAVLSALGVSYHYPFSYLIIPTSMRLREDIKPGSQSRFRVSEFGMAESAEWVYRHPEGGPACFRTDLTYRVKAVSVAPWLNFAMQTLRLLKGAEWKLPRLGEEVRFATAFDLSPENFRLLNDLFEYLEKSSIQYLAVCCRKGDHYYRNLRSSAINSTEYRVLANFPLQDADSLTLDVRCL